jgi:hypothetical protein
VLLLFFFEHNFLGSEREMATGGAAATTGEKYQALSLVESSLKGLLVALDNWKQLEGKPEDLAEPIQTHLRTFIERSDTLAYLYEKDSHHALHTLLLKDDPRDPAQLFDETRFSPFLDEQLSEFSQHTATLQDFRQQLRQLAQPVTAPSASSLSVDRAHPLVDDLVPPP